MRWGSVAGLTGSVSGSGGLMTGVDGVGAALFSGAAGYGSGGLEQPTAIVAASPIVIAKTGVLMFDDLLCCP